MPAAEFRIGEWAYIRYVLTTSHEIRI